MELVGKVYDNKGERQTVWVFPAPFGAMQYINHPHCLKQEKEELGTQRSSQRTTSVQFEEAVVRLESEFRELPILQVVNLKNIRAGEQLCVDYDPIYHFTV